MILLTFPKPRRAHLNTAPATAQTLSC